MKGWTSNQRLWFYRVLTLLATAVLTHVLAVWAVPRLIMRAVIAGPQVQQMQALNHAAHTPAVDASARRIVMPSPDMLYSICVVDLSDGPLHVTAQPRLSSYWSIALYASNSDNFFVLNDRQVGDAAVNLWLVSDKPSASDPPVPAGARVVRFPSSKGLLLMRVLTGHYATESALLEPARRTLQCRPARS